MKKSTFENIALSVAAVAAIALPIAISIGTFVGACYIVKWIFF